MFEALPSSSAGRTQRETDRRTDRPGGETETDRERQRDRDRQAERHTEGDAETDRQTERDRQTETERDKDTRRDYVHPLVCAHVARKTQNYMAQKMQNLYTIICKQRNISNQPFKLIQYTAKCM